MVLARLTFSNTDLWITVGLVHILVHQHYVAFPRLCGNSSLLHFFSQ